MTTPDVKTYDITPAWSGLVPMFLELARGNAKQRENAEFFFKDMAAKLDKQIERNKSSAIYHEGVEVCAPYTMSVDDFIGEVVEWLQNHDDEGRLFTDDEHQAIEGWLADRVSIADVREYVNQHHELTIEAAEEGNASYFDRLQELEHNIMMKWFRDYEDGKGPNDSL